MGCNCSTSTASNDCSRMYMRIDGIIFNKKYVSKLKFDGLKLYIYFVGECKPYIFDLWSEKSNTQIAEYLLELNSCSAPQEDMSIDDHSKLINLDLENQHPVASIIGLSESLSTLALKKLELVAEEGQDTFDLTVDLTNKNTLVFVNGLLLFSNKYTISSNNIVFNNSLSLNEEVIILYQ